MNKIILIIALTLLMSTFAFSAGNDYRITIHVQGRQVYSFDIDDYEFESKWKSLVPYNEDVCYIPATVKIRKLGW